MGKTFRGYDMNQQLLLPPDLRQWLREDHLALYVSDVVESLDLSAITKVYDEGDLRGRPPYHPALMVKLLIYGYCVGKMSSRKLEQATYDDVAFRVLSCNQQPDHDSIAGFRKRHLQELARLFVQVLQLCERAGLVKLGHVAIDDPDSRMMKDLVTQSFQQGYNAHIGVDAQAQIIVGAKVVQAGNDQQQLVPVLQEVAQNLGKMPEAASADGGYFSTAALTHEALGKVNLHVPPNEREPDLGETLPASASVQQRMWQKLKSPDGRLIYNRRQAIVEPVFAYIKHVRGFRQFLLRGLAQVEAEWLLVCMTHNLLKLFSATKRPRLT